jgi:hypothetical protein
VVNRLDDSSSSVAISSWDDVVDGCWPFDHSDSGVLYDPELDSD